jgi:hypothetical protein
LFQCDFSKGLPKRYDDEVDFIISTYAITIWMINKNYDHQPDIEILNSNGWIVFGDVLTELRKICKGKRKDHDLWDEEEYYLVAKM